MKSTIMRTDIPILDCHVHVFKRDWTDRLIRDIEHTGANQFSMVITGRDAGDPQGCQLETGFWIKQRFPDRAFLFGGLDYRGLFDRKSGRPDVPFEKQLQDLIDVGCDGCKLLIGKPNVRKSIGVALDSDVFQPMLNLAEKTKFPLLWHVSDPPEFWSEHTVPPWARTRGWWYDESQPKRDQIEREINAVFERHPRLNLILPHFFFLSNRLDDATKLLEAHPSYNFDLAPGVEMLHNFTAAREPSRAFFIRFADRILFGTDFGMSFGWSTERGNMIRQFLETDEPFEVPDDPAMTPDEKPPLRGLALPKDVLEKIYFRNFHRIVGEKPRPLNLQARPEWMQCPPEFRAV